MDEEASTLDRKAEDALVPSRVESGRYLSFVRQFFGHSSHRRLQRIAFALGVIFLVASLAALVTDTGVFQGLISGIVGLVISVAAASLGQDSKQSPGRPYWRRPGMWLALGCAVSLVATLLQGPPQSEIPPDVAIGFADYEFGPGLHGKLVPHGEHVDAYSNETADAVQLSLRVTVENREAEPLRGVRLELSYPENIGVNSTGQEKVAPNSSGVVYEHVIGTVEPGYPYYASQEDRLSITMRFFRQELCYLDENRMPMCTVLIWDELAGDHRLDCVKIGGSLAFLNSSREGPEPANYSIPFRLFSEGRPMVQGEIDLEPRPVDSVMTTDAGPGAIELTKDDEDWATADVAEDFAPVQGKVLESWEEVLGDTKRVEVSYRKVRTSEGDIHQEISVDGVLRKVLIGRDNWVDQQITNVDGEPDADVLRVFARFFMLDWRSSDFRAAYSSKEGAMIDIPLPDSRR